MSCVFSWVYLLPSRIPCYDHFSEALGLSLWTWVSVFQLWCWCLQKAMPLSNLVRVVEWMRNWFKRDQVQNPDLAPCMCQSPETWSNFSDWFCLDQGLCREAIVLALWKALEDPLQDPCPINIENVGNRGSWRKTMDFEACKGILDLLLVAVWPLGNDFIC